MRRIILTGFMGAGKTTLAQALGVRLGCNWWDLDDLITERAGRSVPALIREAGETYFREAETVALQSALTNLAPSAAQVVALGGGCWTLERNRLLVQQHNGLSVWLDASFALCWERITADGAASRPLAQDYAATKKLYELRREFYAQTELRLTVAPAQTAEELAEIVISQGNLDL